MKPFILTIGREFGSQGGQIGRLIAETYQVPYYDKTVLDHIVMNQNYISQYDLERLDELCKSGLSIRLWSGSDRYLLNKIYDYQSDRIQVFGQTTGGVFVGRCADYILRGMQNHLSIFIYSPIEVRTAYLMNKYGLSLDATNDLINRMDQSRHNYYKYFTKEVRGERHNRQMFLDSSLLGPEGSAELIQHIICQKYL